MQTRIMGILNVTPDSFSDGGRNGSAEAAIDAGIRLFEEGAAIVDVGGESTRPGAPPVSLEEELRRTIPVVEGLAKAGIPVSIDTMKAGVMRMAVAAGAVMLNDVSALAADPESVAAARDCDAEIVLMHMRGNPRTMQNLAEYEDVVEEVISALLARVAACEASGIERCRLLIDPGIGFGKTLEHNLAILRRLQDFTALGLPVILGASRKSVISGVVGPTPVDARLPGSLALALRGAEAGVAWVRVHDVAETAQALKMWQAMRPPV